MEEEDGVTPVMNDARSTRAQKRATSVAMKEVEKDDPKAVMKQNQVKDIMSSAPLFTFQPGEYEIVLCVDNAETSGKYVYFRVHVTAFTFYRKYQSFTFLSLHNFPKDCSRLLLPCIQILTCKFLLPFFTRNYLSSLVKSLFSHITRQSEGGGRVTGRHMTKDIIISELGRHGVAYDVRKLHVGDFLWVCRELITVS